ncbi:unnamed protein product [Adineta ricciae]|uniref:Uncharacterized protein n=1 Tax=Adineta ricciae TaxID=249248 RepID=A0A815W6R9_ADIRI|nr:unnamed protein product [Adineta ricciae]
MYIFFLLSLILLPLVNAEQHRTKFDNNDELIMHRSGAVNYLFGYPMRPYQHPLANPTMDRSFDSDDQQQQRGKRIYWENLAFQPADYNKAKNPKRSK